MSYISPLAQYGVFLYGLARKPNCTKFSYSKKVNKDSFKVSYQDERYRKIQISKNLSILTTRSPSFSPNQIRNGFKTFSIGTQNRQTRNRILSIWNLPTENEKLDSIAIILINDSRKWGVSSTDELICEIDDFFQNFYHQIVDLYNFGNSEIIDLIYSKKFLAG